MKRLPIALLCMTLTATHAVADDSLEPCINGGVSASGNYASQGQENELHLALEPCINGGVSASGNHASQAQEHGSRVNYASR